MDDSRRAADLLRSARATSGLSQAQLAGLLGTHQSAIAAYESGSRQPTVPTLTRMIEATGHRLAMSLERDPRILTLAQAAEAMISATNDSERLRIFFEWSRGAGEDGGAPALLVTAEPAPTGDERFDALLAAAAEDLCVQCEIPPPSWALHPNRFLNGVWWVSNLPSARAHALVHTPASYRRRGIMLDRHDLVAA